MKIAIVGATGLVGRTMLNILGEFGYIQNCQIVLYASKNSANKHIFCNEKSFCIRELSEQNIDKDIDFALFSAGGEIAKTWAKKFTKNGTIVIDNSNAFRRYKSVPLVVPEINFKFVQKNTKIIANPNCTTIGLCLTIAKLNEQNPIKRVVVNTYQAVSGAGQKGLIDLECGTANKFIYPIKNNLLPHIDVFLKNGNTKEEDKIVFETSKILGQKIAISATAVRVPIKNCHSESINIEFEKTISPKTARKILVGQQGVAVLDDCINNLYPMPLQADNTNAVFVGRIRKDYSKKSSLNMFICFDNLRKGAALNAVQIMTKYIEKFY